MVTRNFIIFAIAALLALVGLTNAIPSFGHGAKYTAGEDNKRMRSSGGRHSVSIQAGHGRDIFAEDRFLKEQESKLATSARSKGSAINRRHLGSGRKIAREVWQIPVGKYRTKKRGVRSSIRRKLPTRDFKFRTSVRAKKGKNTVKINGKRLPKHCRCKREGPGEGDCYYFSEKNSNYCDVRYCEPKYVCVSGKKSALTCFLRRVKEKIVPDGDYTCKVKKVNGYMYVPYAE